MACRVRQAVTETKSWGRRAVLSLVVACGGRCVVVTAGDSSSMKESEGKSLHRMMETTKVMKVEKDENSRGSRSRGKVG